MHENPRQIISQELWPGEKLIWYGKPRPGIRLRIADILLIPFTLLWGSLALTTLGWRGLRALYIPGMLANPLGLFIYVPFLLFGLYVTVGRYVMDHFQRMHTYYGLTNLRIIIVSGVWQPMVESYEIGALEDIQLVSSRNRNYGIITFGFSHPLASWLSGIPWPGLKRFVGPSFDLIQDARKVYTQLLWLRQNSDIPGALQTEAERMCT